MTENEVVEIVRSYIESQFPKKCPSCGRRYRSLKEYLLETTHLGDPISYDAEKEDWQPKQPIGTVSQCEGRTLHR